MKKLTVTELRGLIREASHSARNEPQELVGRALAAAVSDLLEKEGDALRSTIEHHISMTTDEDLMVPSRYEDLQGWAEDAVDVSLGEIGEKLKELAFDALQGLMASKH